MLEGMVTEKELLKLMDLKPTELAYLRSEKGMPFVRLSRSRRVYLEADLMDWFKANKEQGGTAWNPAKPRASQHRQGATGDGNSDDTDL